MCGLMLPGGRRTAAGCWGGGGDDGGGDGGWVGGWVGEQSGYIEVSAGGMWVGSAMDRGLVADICRLIS